MRNLILLIVKLLLRPWDLPRRVERQKLTVISQEEMSVRVLSVRVWKGGCCGQLTLHTCMRGGPIRPKTLFHMFSEFS